MANVSVKWFHDGMFRRFGLEVTDSTDLFATLRAKTDNLVPGFNKNLAWKDCEGDLIVFCSDSELCEAIRSAGDGLLRIYTVQQEASGTETPNGEKTETEGQGQAHAGVVCDGCNGGIYGFRYKCLHCDDFDLCSGCEAKGTHREHNMIRINDPHDHSWRVFAIPFTTAQTQLKEVRDQVSSLEHACECREANCRRLSCHKIKRVMSHTKLCRKRQQGNCPVCKQLMDVCSDHAKHCTIPACKVPFCDYIGRRMNKMNLQNRSEGGATMPDTHPNIPSQDPNMPIRTQPPTRMPTIPRHQQPMKHNYMQMQRDAVSPRGMRPGVPSYYTQQMMVQQMIGRLKSARNQEQQGLIIEEMEQYPTIVSMVLGLQNLVTWMFGGGCTNVPCTYCNNAPTQQETNKLEKTAAAGGDTKTQATPAPQPEPQTQPPPPPQQMETQSPQQEWTLLDTPATQLPRIIPVTIDDGPSPPPQQLYPNATAPEVVNQTQGNVHPDARVNETVNNLMAMGFGNEGGWLTQLVEQKKGDINATLNALQPHH